MTFEQNLLQQLIDTNMILQVPDRGGVIWKLTLKGQAFVEKELDTKYRFHPDKRIMIGLYYADKFGMNMT